MLYSVHIRPLATNSIAEELFIRERFFAYKFGGIRGASEEISVCSFLVPSAKYSKLSIDLGRTNGLDHKRAGDDYWDTTHIAQVCDNL